MKEHSLAVTTLEEYEPNREFVGRNFNGGEIIQLVLRARSGHWLPFSYVQMVMMHELAHCVQMNHSRAFWKVRNLYADQMRALWGRGYTGDGMWGRGALLATGEFEAGGAVAGGEELPEHLCGGTYRSRGRGRGRKRRGKGGEDLSYREKKQRRIERKFGKNGVALGADDDVKARLEKGRRTQAAPRVAGSNRGRDLRAAAALARFEQQKEEVREEDDDDESGDDSDYYDYDDAEDADPNTYDAVDIDGKKLLDAKGNGMVKVCEDENPEGEDAANELKELQSSITNYSAPAKDKDGKNSSTRLGRSEAVLPVSPKQGSRHTSSRNDPNKHAVEGGRATATDRLLGSTRKDGIQAYAGLTVSGVASNKTATPTTTTTTSSNKAPRPESKKGTTCAVCSFANEAFSVTCSMCSNVLNAADVPGTWKCRSAACRDSGYLNAGDCGACGVCGRRKGAGDSREDE